MASLQSLASLIILALLIIQTFNIRSGNVSTTLMDHYDDGSEMNQRIILDYMSSEQCQSWCDRYSRDQLLNDFEHFREDWVQKMINFVIEQLGVDGESARYARKNPSSYMINYQTFKLLSFK